VTERRSGPVRDRDEHGGDVVEGRPAGFEGPDLRRQARQYVGIPQADAGEKCFEPRLAGRLAGRV